MKVCVLFFLLMGEDWDSCNNLLPAWKRQHFVPFFTCWFEGKNWISFLVAFCFTKRRKWESCNLQTTFACLKSQQNRSQSLILFSQKEQHTPISFHFCMESTKAEKCMKAGTTLQRWEANRQQNTFIWTHFFFLLYSFLRRRSSHFKLVVQHIKMKPAKRLSQCFCSLLLWRFDYIFSEWKKNIENVCYRAKEWDESEGVKIKMEAFK